MRSALRALCAAAAFALAATALAAPVRTEHVEAELVAAKTALVPGQPLTVALRLAIDKGWHTYWQNPGDSGLPTTLEWKLPAGVKAGPIEWPAPQLLPAGPLLNYGYENEVLHLVDLKAAPSLVPRMRRPRSRRAPTGSSARRPAFPKAPISRSRCPFDQCAVPIRDGADRSPPREAALPRPLAGWQASAEGRGTTIALKLVAARGREPIRARSAFSRMRSTGSSHRRRSRSRATAAPMC